MLIRKRHLKKHSGVIGGMANTCKANDGTSNGRKKKSGNPEILRCQ